MWVESTFSFLEGDANVRCSATVSSMDFITSIFSGFGLSASAGLNAYIPMMVVGLLNRFTSLIDLDEPYALLSNTWVLSTIGGLIVIEAFADNVPAINHLNDAIQTFIRPVAGAIMFAASASEVGSINQVLALIAGLFVAGTVHATKSVVVRPAVNVATAGVGNTPVSIAEDVFAVGVSVLAVVLPLAVGLVLIGAVIMFLRWRRSRAVSAV